jgi:hypothetical protein
MAVGCPPEPYPETTVDLNRAEAAFLLSVRWRVEDRKKGGDPLVRLRPGLKCIGAEEAAIHLDRFMTHTVIATRRTVRVMNPLSKHVANDEQHLLYAAYLAQADEQALAEQFIEASMTSPGAGWTAAAALAEFGKCFFSVLAMIYMRSVCSTLSKTGDPHLTTSVAPVLPAHSLTKVSASSMVSLGRSASS